MAVAAAQGVINENVELVAASSLSAHPDNPRQGDLGAIYESIKANGFYGTIVAQRSSGRILAGNHRWLAAQDAGIDEVPVCWVDVDDDTARRILLADNRTNDLASYNDQALAELLTLIELETGTLDGTGYDKDALDDLLNDLGLNAEPEGEPNLEPPDDPKSKRGEVYELGRHRLMCGDATDPEDVAALMRDEVVPLIHADPPYGMGKESDGVANDNLYRDKLDRFQMQWWNAFRPHLANNGSAYIWGNAEDLWRLWYVGGLKDSERLTARNEIAWDKGGGGMTVGTAGTRMFTPTERCLFFMLGEQGFNNNADNYWDGWEPIRAYLDEERKKCGWSIPDTKRIAGHSEQSGCHWFDRSQWSMPTEETYRAWQAAAREHDAFKREHDDLKREFYATRAHFDNTHENMTDVWDFPRVQGEERHEHATPKPVEMTARCIKSSTKLGDSLAEPFGGSGSTLIAAEQTGRTCYAMEIEPKYCDVIRRRYAEYVGKPEYAP